MRKLNIALVALGLMAWGCSNMGVNTETVEEQDIEFVAQSTTDETSTLATDLQDPGSPVLNRYYTGGFFVWNYENNGDISILAFPDTLQDSVRLTCVAHRDTMPVDNDGDRVFQHDVITFNCQNQHFLVMRNGNLFDITLTLEGQITHNDQNDDDRAVFQVTWGGENTTDFHKEVLVIKNTPAGADTVMNTNVNTRGEINFDRDSMGIIFHKERFVSSNDREFHVIMDGHILTQEWEPGNPITDDLDIEFTGSADATTTGGRTIEIQMHTDNTITIGNCEGQQRVGVKGGRIVEELYVSGVHVKTITIEFNPDCSYNMSQSQ